MAFCGPKRALLGTKNPIAAIFADGTPGFYYNFSNLATLWQNTAATTPVTAAGQSIARANDSSPSGNNATQAAGPAQPKWQAGGIAQFDGVDDYLGTLLAPGPAMTYLVKLKVGAIAGRQIVGATDGVNGRAFMGLDAAGLLAGGVGAQSITTIKGGADVRGQTIVAGLRFNGATVTLFNGATTIYSAAQAGSPSAIFPVFLGGINNGSVPFSFSDSGISQALAIKKALSAEQMAPILKLWSTL